MFLFHLFNFLTAQKTISYAALIVVVVSFLFFDALEKLSKGNENNKYG